MSAMATRETMQLSRTTLSTSKKALKQQTSPFLFLVRLNRPLHSYLGVSYLGVLTEETVRVLRAIWFFAGGHCCLR